MQKLRRCAVLLVLTVVGCAIGPDARPSVPDAGNTGAAPDVTAQLDALRRSRQAWDALVAAMGDTYSYTEENCVVNASEHTLTTVQVDNGSARLFGKSTISGEMCLAQVNRYEDFTPRTLPELYADCEALIQREGAAVSLTFDERGVIQGCTWPGDAGCDDNCGEGFYLRALLFGVLEVP